MKSNGDYVLTPGTAERRWMGATFTDFLATGELTGGKFAMIERAGGMAPLEQVDDKTIGQACEDFGIMFVGPLPAQPGTS